MKPEMRHVGALVVLHLTTAEQRLARISEQERQRLSHESRLNLDLAERDLRRAIRALDDSR